LKFVIASEVKQSKATDKLFIATLDFHDLENIKLFDIVLIYRGIILSKVSMEEAVSPMKSLPAAFLTTFDAGKGVELFELSLRPEKTFVGRAHKGFDLLGYHIPPPRFDTQSNNPEKSFRESKAALCARRPGVSAGLSPSLEKLGACGSSFNSSWGE